MKRHVVTVNACGLGNRLKSLLSTLRLSTCLSRTPAVYWPRNELCGCDFSDLFDSDIQQVGRSFLADGRLYRLEGSRECPTVLFEDRQNPDKMLISSWRLIPLPEEIPEGFAQRCPIGRGDNVDFEYHRIPVSFRSKYLQEIQRLRARKEIEDEVRGFSGSLSEDTVAVSVRSWPERKRRARHFDIKDLYEVLDGMDGLEMFVSCDAPGILAKIVRRYGSRLRYHRKRTFVGDRRSRAGMQDILTDLLLLSRGRTLVVYSGKGAPRCSSTFSEMAWWLGGCRARTIVVGGKS
ncbi:MAG TPA: hypothetical protein VMY37_30775 [Thermoguttaceae bacterium]|nr:hypothetical protein [Thermoguttaceae bacterium]